MSYPKSRVDLVDRYLDEPRKLRVAVVGGGLAGIISGCLLPAKVPGIELVIYEKNADFVSPPDPQSSGAIADDVRINRVEHGSRMCTQVRQASTRVGFHVG